MAGDSPDDYTSGASAYGSLAVYEGRNNFRMPNYHRMDLGANFHRKFKHARRTINASIYNVYNRQNPYMIYQSATDGYRSYPYSLKQLSIFPILPSVAYTLYF